MNLHKASKNLLIFFIAGIILAFWAKPSFSDKIDRAYDHLDQGIALLRKGKTYKALEEFQRSWDLGGLPEACYKIAEIYDKRLNDNRKAIKFYTKFLAVEYDTPRALKAQDLLNRVKRDIIAVEKWKGDLSEKEFNSSEYVDPIRKELGPTKERKEEESIRYRDTEKEYPTQPTVCLTCHGGYMGPGIDMEATHPVGRIPKGKLDKTVPWEVRFYKEGRVICMSCHNPEIIHFSEGMEGKNYRTLRVDTEDGEDMPRFCAFCHSEKVSPRVIRRQERRQRETEEDYDDGMEFEWEGRGSGRESADEVDDIMDFER